MLINCPKCGKPISEYADICMHCKSHLKEETMQSVDNRNKQMKNYLDLSEEEKKELYKQFEKENPTLKGERDSLIKNNKVSNIALIIFLISGILPSIYSILTTFSSSLPKLSLFIRIVFGIIAVVSLVISIISHISIKSNFKKLAEKDFDEWLEERNYVIDFDRYDEE